MRNETVELRGKDLDRESAPANKSEAIAFMCKKFLWALEQLGVKELNGEIEKENGDKILITIKKVEQ